MLENIKNLKLKKPFSHPSIDYLGNPIELDDVLLINSNSTFKIGVVLSISLSTLQISCERHAPDKWNKRGRIIDSYSQKLEINLSKLAKHNSTLRINNYSGCIINLTKLNLIA